MKISNANVGTRDIDQMGSILALLLVATVTEAMLLVLPLYMGALIDVMSLNEIQLGILGSADLAGIAFSTLTAVLWLRKVKWRQTVIVFLSLFIVFNILSMYTSDYLTLTTLRFMTGLVGGGAYAIALAGLCDTIKEERNTALMVCGQVIFGSAGAFILPLVSDEWRINSVYLYMVIWAAVALMLTVWLFPANTHQSQKTKPKSQVTLSLSPVLIRGLCVIAGTAFYFVTVGAVWAFLERIARNAGLDSHDVATSLGWGYLISLLGSFGAAYLGARWGRAIPMAVSGVVQITMLALLTRISSFENTLVAFFVINAVFQFFWSYIIAYQIVIFNDVDPSGRFVAAYGTSMHLALAVGPFIGAYLVRDGNYTSLLTFGIITLAACYTAFLLAIFLSRKPLINIDATAQSS